MTTNDLVSSAVAGALLTPHPYHALAVISKWIAAHLIVVGAAILRSQK
jgi:uncharacterized membrane protein HdeD (DUF308 family)